MRGMSTDSRVGADGVYCWACLFTRIFVSCCKIKEKKTTYFSSLLSSHYCSILLSFV